MKQLLSPMQVADRLGMSRNTIWRFIREGKLKVITFSGGRTPHYRVDEADLEAFIEANKKGGEE